MNAIDYISEKSRRTQVCFNADICIVGGSSTGVFAAIRAARLGAKVALIENNGFFGGVATAGLVNIWHSFLDTEHKVQIIGGLSSEIIQRLKKRNAVVLHAHNHSKYAVFNSFELAVELDEIVGEHKNIRPFLHSRFTDMIMEKNRIRALIIEDKSGRRAIRANYFVDASGDGDLLSRSGFAFTKRKELQPPTTCMILNGLDSIEKKNPEFDITRSVFDKKYKEALKNGFLWTSEIPGLPSARLVAGTRVHGVDCSDADKLTYSEMEGRRQARMICDLIRNNFKGGDRISIAALASYIGIRETRHAKCLYTLTEKDLLKGKRFDDSIANGSYRIDIHHSGKGGLSFRYLDGREVYIDPSKKTVERRWRKQIAVNPTFYQIPYRSILPLNSKNLIVAGRIVDTDRGAYGAVRVMVLCNQTGEAAGLACAIAASSKIDLPDLDPAELRRKLADGGSIVI